MLDLLHSAQLGRLPAVRLSPTLYRWILSGVLFFLIQRSPNLIEESLVPEFEGDEKVYLPHVVLFAGGVIHHEPADVFWIEVSVARRAFGQQAVLHIFRH